MKIDSTSTGDAARHCTLADLEKNLLASPPAPAHSGRVALIVRKAAGGVRETPDRVTLAPETGVPGDAWGRNEKRKLDGQISVMQRDVAELIANGQPLGLAGDNLFLDLDISAANLPTGSQLKIGETILEVTPLAHNGCKKFRARFGDDALRFVSKPELRPRNLRGIFLRVVRGGEVGVGDVVDILLRVVVQQTIREVKYGSMEHAATIELRAAVLRTPLGLTFPPEELAGEQDFHHLACYRGSKLAACLVLQPLANGDVQMKQVAVVPDLQRQGVGRAIVVYSEKFAAQLGYRRMTLHARETAVPFYEKYGYTKIGDRFTQVNLPHWEMVKSL